MKILCLLFCMQSWNAANATMSDAKTPRSITNQHYTQRHIQSQIQRYTDRQMLYDSSRKRSIPVEISLVAAAHGKKEVVVISGGYDSTLGAYSFLADTLARAGYLVVDVQHDLPDDAPVATTGNLYELRKPVWKRGVDNILFAIKTLQRQHPAYDYDHLILIGHSNGGDISILFAATHPTKVAQAITLDHRRMPIPRAAKPAILSLRASDTEADAGVLPTAEEQQTFGIRIVRLTDARHNDMWNGGSETLRSQIVQYIASFLGSSRK